jgi:hypothetical protein
LVMMYQEIQEERVFQTSLLVHELNKNYNSCPWHFNSSKLTQKHNIE